MSTKLESKNCKHATQYARPLPAIAGIAVSIQTSFGPLDLGSSQKKNRKLALPQGSYNFSLNKL
jgi:hypothetical protein